VDVGRFVGESGFVEAVGLVAFEAGVPPPEDAPHAVTARPRAATTTTATTGCVVRRPSTVDDHLRHHPPMACGGYNEYG
jgi:hypothetical protein